MLSDEVLISYADLWTVGSEGCSKNLTVILSEFIVKPWPVFCVVVFQ